MHVCICVCITYVYMYMYVYVCVLYIHMFALYMCVFYIHVCVCVCVHAHFALVVVLQVTGLTCCQGRKLDSCSGHCKMYIHSYLFLIMKRTENNFFQCLTAYLITINILPYLLLLLFKKKTLQIEQSLIPPSISL